jgi:REP element-mobilizing transposase RayT
VCGHKVGGTNDHTHVCCSLARTIACARLLERMKKNSSKWMKTQSTASPTFAWQDGYAVFSVSASQLEATKRYIEEQPAHHRTVSFEDEFRALMDRNGISYDERYCWD